MPPTHVACLWAGLATACIAASLSISAQTSPQKLSAETQHHIEHVESGLIGRVVIAGDAGAAHTLAERMAALHVPGVSIAVLHKGQLEWAQGFGFARVGGARVGPDTLFQAGSISKPLAAMAALTLVEQGKLSLDADVNTYLTSWKLPSADIAQGKPVTLRELLTHTAGMTVHGFPGYAADAPVPTLVQVLNGVTPANTRAIRVEATPGTKWDYSGGGYTVMQQMMIDVTGEAFPALLAERVLGPIGMTHSTYMQPLPADRKAHASTPYNEAGKPYAGGAHTYPEMAAAGLWTTPSDLVKYAQEVEASLTAQAGKHVLSPGMTRQMLAKGMGNWGLGLQIGGTDADPTFGHGGSNVGFESDFIAFEREGEGAVVMTNAARGSLLCHEVMNAIAKDYGWSNYEPPTARVVVPLAANILARYAGTYMLGPGFGVVIRVDGGKLFATYGKEAPVVLYAESDTKFFPLEFAEELEFTRDDKGAVNGMVLKQAGGREMKAQRAGSTQAAPQ